MSRRGSERSWHGYMRLMLGLAAVGWTAWHPLQMAMVPGAQDPLPMRLAVALAALLALAMTWVPGISRAWIERAFVVVGALLTAHVFVLVRVNAMNTAYITAALIVLPAASACMPSLRTLGILLGLAMALALFAVDFTVSDVADAHFLAAMATEVAVLLPALAMRLRLTRKLSATAETLDTILDNAATGIARIDRSGNFVRVNRGFAEMLEQSPQSLIGQPWTGLVHPDERARAEESLRSVLAFGDRAQDGVSAYYRVQSAKGRTVWVRTVGRSLADESGKVDGLVVVAADVTKERELELVFNGQQRLLELLADGTAKQDVMRAAVAMVSEQIEPIGVIALRMSEDNARVMPLASHGVEDEIRMRYVDASTADWAMLAGTATASHKLAVSIFGMPWAEAFYAAAEKVGIRAAFAAPAIGKKGQVLGAIEVHLGQARLPTEHEERIVAAAAEVLGLALERAQIERLIDEQKATITASAKMASLGEMAAGIAHEINNPMTIIKGRSYLIRKLHESGKLSPEELVRACDSIDQTVQRVTKIIQGLKTFARSDAFDVKSCSLVTTVVADTLAFCAERFRAHGIRLDVEGVGSELWTLCRPTQISQVLLNLLGNAFDAVETLHDPWVRLEVRDAGEEIEMIVSDSGAGIPAATREKIFQPFFSTKEIGKGTGLGLSISLGIVKDHGGRLWVDAAAANTRFVLALPKAERPAEAAA